MASAKEKIDAARELENARAAVREATSAGIRVTQAHRDRVAHAERAYNKVMGK
jgi:hypothetical protein